MHGSQFEVNSDGLVQAITALGKPIHIYLLGRIAVTIWFRLHVQTCLYVPGAIYPQGEIWLNGRSATIAFIQPDHILKQDSCPPALACGTVIFAVNRSDSVQDLLALLAQEIIRLNLQSGKAYRNHCLPRLAGQLYRPAGRQFGAENHRPKLPRSEWEEFKRLVVHYRCEGG